MSPSARARLRALALLGLVACSRPSVSTAQADETRTTAPGACTPTPAPGTYCGRAIAPVMGSAGADWLERPDRAKTEQPDRVIAALALAPGSVVADIGAGTGYFSLRLARAVGPAGRVIATDLQPEMLAMLRRNAADAGASNVELVQSTESDAMLAPASLDLALMVDVYHELSRPAETMAQVRRALKPGGRLVLVEYRGEDPDVPIKPEHTMTLAQVRLEMDFEGFRVKDVLEFLPQQRVIVCVPRPGDGG